MGQENGIRITNRDRVLRAWQNSMELVRDFQNAADVMHDDGRVVRAFRQFAEEEAAHAAKFLEFLHAYEAGGTE